MQASTPWVLTWVVALAAPAVCGAVALRGVELGEPCQRALEVESGRGSTPGDDARRMLERGFLLFTNHQSASMQQQILYRCASGQDTVAAYTISMSTTSEHTARSAYAGAVANMRSRMGTPPAIDSESLSLISRIRHWRQYSPSFAVHESCEWPLANGQFAAVTLQKMRDGASWQVIARNELHPAAAAGTRHTTAQLLASAITMALASAAITAALMMLPLQRFRWLMAVAVPFWLGVDLLWFPTWNATAARGPATDIPTAVACVLAGLIVSLAIARWMRPHSALAPPSHVPSRRGGAWVLAGLGVFAVLLGALSWALRPGNPLGADGQLLLQWGGPCALVLGTFLLLRGTARLAAHRHNVGARLGALAAALDVVGVLGSVAGATLCLNIATELLLAI